MDGDSGACGGRTTVAGVRDRTSMATSRGRHVCRYGDADKNDDPCAGCACLNDLIDRSLHLCTVQGPKPAQSTFFCKFVIKYHEPTGWTEPSQASNKPAAVQKNGVDSGYLFRGPSSTWAEPRKAWPVHPALIAGIDTSTVFLYDVRSPEVTAKQTETFV
jgi:hypothetical protein